MLYGAGPRLMECLRLRVPDVGVGRCEIVVRDGKGAKARVTMLPASLRTSLVVHLGEVERVHRVDVAAGWGRYYIRTVQELLGHSDVKTTMIYTHGLNRDPAGVRSPVDALLGEGRWPDPCTMPA